MKDLDYFEGSVICRKDDEAIFIKAGIGADDFKQALLSFLTRIEREHGVQPESILFERVV